MTREEAIEVIEQDIPCEYDTDLIEALNMAISALKAEPCEDAVNREAVLEIISDFGYKNTHEEMLINERIRALPPVTPKPRTGKWMKTGQSFINPNRFRNYCCSECGWELDEHIRIEPHYCPNCGAKMEGGSE